MVENGSDHAAAAPSVNATSAHRIVCAAVASMDESSNPVAVSGTFDVISLTVWPKTEILTHGDRADSHGRMICKLSTMTRAVGMNVRKNECYYLAACSVNVTYQLRHT